MKKILLASSALAGASLLATSAMAQVTIGATANVGFQATAHDTAKSSNEGFYTDFEVSFSGSKDTKVGKVGFHVELNADADTADIDESDVYLEGGWGKVQLGNNDGAADWAGVNGTSAIAIDGASTASEIVDLAADGGDNAGITYTTPSMGGFQAAVSYVAENGTADTDNSNTVDADETRKNAVGLGVKYSGDMGGASVTVSAAYAQDESTHSNIDEDRSGYMLGASVAMSGFTVAAGYINETTDNGKGTGIDDDNSGWNLGVAYAMGDTTIGAIYSDLDEADAQNLGLGVSHNLGEGVSITFGVSDGETAGVDTQKAAVELKTSW